MQKKVWTNCRAELVRTKQLGLLSHKSHKMKSYESFDHELPIKEYLHICQFIISHMQTAKEDDHDSCCNYHSSIWMISVVRAPYLIFIYLLAVLIVCLSQILKAANKLKHRNIERSSENEHHLQKQKSVYRPRTTLFHVAPVCCPQE